MATTEEAQSSADQQSISDWLKENDGTIWAETLKRVMKTAAKRKKEEEESADFKVPNRLNPRLLDEIELQESILREHQVPRRHIDTVLPWQKLDLQEGDFRYNDYKHLKNVVLKDTPAILATKAWFQAQQNSKFAWSFTLAGGQGCGKSVAAAYWLKKLLVKSLAREKYWISPDPGAKIGSRRYAKLWWEAAEINRTWEMSAAAIREMKNEPFMVIDDLGVEHIGQSGGFRSRFDELMNHRWGNYLPTMITTNLNAAAFKERYQGRVADRMKEGFKAGGAFLELKDKSFRGK